MFVIDQRPFIASVESAQGSLDRQKAILWNAQQTKARMVPLYEKNAVSQRDLDQALASELAAVAEVETAQADLYKAQINLGFTSISAPVSGPCKRSEIPRGSLDRPRSGRRQFTDNALRCRPDLGQFQHFRQRPPPTEERCEGKTDPTAPRMKFQIEAILSDGTVVPTAGVIDFNNPAIQQSTGTMLFRAVIPNPKLLIYPGQFVKVIVKGAIRPNAIAVPQTAVMQNENGDIRLHNRKWGGGHKKCAGGRMV